MNGFTYFHSYHKAIRRLPNELRLVLHDAIDDYMFDDIEQEFDDPTATAMFELMRPHLDCSKRNGKNKGKKSAENEEEVEVCSEENGNEMETEWTSDGNEMENEKSPSEKKKKKEKKKEKEKDKERITRAREIPPTIEEVRAYCQERQNGVDPERWYSYYSANGWRVGKNPMKDWRAAVRTWERNGFDNKGGELNGNGAPKGWGAYYDQHGTFG